MFFVAAFTYSTIASARFQGVKVELVFDRARSQISLRSIRGGVLEKVQVADSPDESMGEPYLHDSTVSVEPIGSDGRSYLIASIAMNATSGGMCGTAFVFDRVNGHLRKVGQLDSNQMFEFPTIGPGRRVIARSYEIGERMSHAEMPRWQEFFEVKHSHLVRVAHSARLYRPWMGWLWETLLQYPDDPACWHYYGIAAECSGSQVRPQDAYRRMLAARKRWDLNESSDAHEVASWLKGEEKADRWPRVSTRNLGKGD